MSERLVIEIYCDDPRHARGKVAEVGQLMPLSAGWSVLPPSEVRAGRMVSRKVGDRRGRVGPTHHLDSSPTSPAGRRHHEITCPLCPRRPQLTDENLSEIADALSAAGMVRVSLGVLDAFAAKIASGEGESSQE